MPDIHALHGDKKYSVYGVPKKKKLHNFGSLICSAFFSTPCMPHFRGEGEREGVGGYAEREISIQES